MGSKQLSHSDFYTLIECVKANRDGIAQTVGWQDCHEFIVKHLRAIGSAVDPSHHSIVEACNLIGVVPRKQYRGGRIKSSSRDSLRDDLEILSRALGRLYERLGEPPTAGLQRLLDIARGKTPADTTPAVQTPARKPPEPDILMARRD